MKHLRFLGALALFLALPLCVSAQQPQENEIKLRDALRNSTLQLRKAQSDIAALQVTSAEMETERDALKKQLGDLTKQSEKERVKAEKEIADLTAKSTGLETKNSKLMAELTKTREFAQQASEQVKIKEQARANLEVRVLDLERTVADRESKNVALVKVAQEILHRLERFGLGDAIKAKEPFVGAKRVQIQALAQEYTDKILDQKYQPGVPAAPAPSPAPSASAKPAAPAQAAKTTPAPAPKS